MIEIGSNIFISENDVTFTAIRSSGPGGQNVNKVSTGIQLRFNVKHSGTLPDDLRLRLITQLKTKMTHEGDLIIKAIRYRTQQKNKQDAITRLATYIFKALTPPKKRKPTKPSAASSQRRLDKKKQHSKMKALRRKKPEI